MTATGVGVGVALLTEVGDVAGGMAAAGFGSGAFPKIAPSTNRTAKADRTIFSQFGKRFFDGIRDFLVRRDVPTVYSGNLPPLLRGTS